MEEMKILSRFIGRYSLGRDGGRDSLHFLRIKIPGGVIDSERLRTIAELSLNYGRGYAEITDRQDIQLHWIDSEHAIEIFSILDSEGLTTDMCGQAFPYAGRGDVRNIVGCPLAGIGKEERINGHPLIKKLTEFFSGNPEFLDLPKKFKFSISGCRYDCTRSWINDMAFVPAQKDDEWGFTAIAGGGAGSSLPGPRKGEPLNIFLYPDDVFEFAVATVEIFRDYGDRSSKNKARFKYLFEKMGRKEFLKIVSEKTGMDFEEHEGDVRRPWKEHCGTGILRDHRKYINIPLRGGILTAEKIQVLADLTDRYGSGELRLTPFQNVIIPEIDDVEDLKKELKDAGFRTEGICPEWTAVGCASDFCGKTRDYHAKNMVSMILDRIGKYDKLKERDVKIGVSGCKNNCGYSVMAHIGLVGRPVRYNGDVKQAYDIHMGKGLENGGSELFIPSVPAGRVVEIVERIVKMYSESEYDSFPEFAEKYEDEIRSLEVMDDGRYKP